MARQALNTYLEPEQKQRLERMAQRRGVPQAVLVREAIVAYLERDDPSASSIPAEEAWERLLGGYYDGDGRRNDHDDIYQ